MRDQNKIINVQSAHPRKFPHRSRMFGALLLGSTALICPPVFADDLTLPSGGVVTNGSAQFNYNTPGELHINQQTDRVIIDWSSFNIGTNALTQFHQNSSSSIAVNKVTGSFEPTKILGSLIANGQVVILDQNGVIFGRDSHVDVGGIVVSTGQINEASFMSGATVLELSDMVGTGSIINEGNITIAEAGLAAFVAPTVVNNGIIEAKLGRIALASGSAATVDLYGDGLVELAAPQLNNAMIDNKGTIRADGGKIILSASAAKNLVDSTINTSGVISAASVFEKGGKIILEGPSIQVSGKIDVSGHKGGGQINIGGEWQGGGSTRHAELVTITEGAELKANTLGTDGDGGEIVLWSDKATIFEGDIEALGGSGSGNGGRVETSSKLNLRIIGSVNASANNDSGLSGEWLLDPQNVRITNSAGASIPVGGGTYDPSGTDNPFVILDTSISDALNAGNNVTITTMNAGQAQSGDITLDNASILKSTSNNDVTLSLLADRSIIMNNSTINNTSSNKLNIAFNADRNADNVGSINLSGSSITTNGGWLVAGGGSGSLWGLDGIKGTGDDSASTGADRIAAYGVDSGNRNGVEINNTHIKTGDGDIIINGNGRMDAALSNERGVYIYGGSIIEATNGTLKISGTGGSGEDANYGVHITGAGTRIESEKGAITVAGVGGSAGTGTSDFNYGVEISSGATIKSAGTGNDASTITINATGGNGAATNKGIVIDGATITTTKGNVSITGTGQGSSGNKFGIDIRNGTSIESLGSANLTFTGTATGSSNIVLSTTGANNVIGGAAATGNITFNADSMALASANIQTTGSSILKVRTNTTAINLGTSSAGGLELDDAELALFNVGTFVAGDSGFTNPAHDITVDSWNLSGKTFSVELYGNDITFQDTDGTPGVDYAVNLGVGNFMAHAKDNDPGDKAALALNAKIAKSLSGTSLLDLRADQGIIINSSSGIATTVGSLNVILNADRDADQDGNIYINSSSITTNGGHFVAGGGSGAAGGINGILGDGDGTGADDVAAWNPTNRGIEVVNGSSISTGAGAVIMKGTGRDRGFFIGGSSNITTTSGKIDLYGTIQAAIADFVHGVAVDNGATINSTTGEIILTGHGSTNVSYTNSAGISFYSGVGVNNGIITNGASNITLNAFSNAASTVTLEMTTANLVTIGGASATGNIAINTDVARLNTATNIQTSGKVTVKGTSAGRNINLGGTTGGLDLNDTELGYFNAGTLVFGDSLNGTGDMIVDSWSLSGKTHHVELYANDITFQDTDPAGGVDYSLNLGSGNFMAYAKDNDPGDKGSLAVNALIKKLGSGSSLLDLRSDHDMFINGNITASTGSLNIVLNSDRDADQDGAIIMSSSAVTTNNGWFVAGGGAGTVWGVDGIQGTADDAASTGADKVAAWGSSGNKSGLFLNNGDISTGTGVMVLNGHGYNGAGDQENKGMNIFSGSHLQSTSGSITLNGIGGNGTLYNTGIDVFGAGTRIESTTGAITLTGTGGSNGLAGSNLNRGINLSDGAVIESLGAGSNASTIILTGRGGAGEDLNFGIEIGFNNAKITSKKGNITLNGYGGNAIMADRTENYGVRIIGTALVESTDSADILIHAEAGATGSQNDMQITSGSNVIGGASATGNITFEVDSAQIENANIQTSNTVLVKPRTASTNINLGNYSTGLNLNDIALATFNAGTLIIGDSGNGTGNVVIDTWDLSSKTHNVQVFGRDMTVSGITLGAGNTTLYSKGTNGVTVNADSISNSAGMLSILSAGNININESLENNGAGSVRLFAGWDGSSAITTPALFDIADIHFGVATRNVTIGANGNIASGANNTAILIAQTGNLQNNSSSGSNALTTPSGRYLVYGTSPSGTVKSGLTAKNLYNQSYASAAPSSIAGASRFVYTYQPTLTLKANDQSVQKLEDVVFEYTISGLLAGDLIADALSAGTPSYSIGTPSGSTAVITFSGNYTSPMGYNIVYANGLVTLPFNYALSIPVDTYSSQVETVAGVESSQGEQKILDENLQTAEKEEASEEGASCLVSDMTGSCLLN